MDTADAIRIITSCAKTYKDELCNKNVLFVILQNQKTHFLETCFMPHNYLHLTGVIYSGGSKNFFRECCERKLSPASISFEANGTTEMKLRVLPQLVKINKTARMFGDYNHSKALLITDKLLGGECGCIGFIQDGSIYIPNTALNEDIRNISVGSCGRILATFTKEVSQDKYSQTTYTAKKVNIEDLRKNSTLKDLLV